MTVALAAMMLFSAYSSRAFLFRSDIEDHKKLTGYAGARTVALD